MAPDSPSSRLHVYARDIEAGAHNSLSELVEHIPAGARVLDLGCGSGAIGAFLHRRDGAVAAIDGLTISEDEAALAAPHYRRVEVANLETCVLPELFASGQYDIIVCADVLEHVRNADAVVSACTGLLAPGGRLLLSIPNAGYAGLVAELMSGEFRYRKEGLLDETHVRFFTQNTLTRFLQENRWVAESFSTIVRQLTQSEFRVAFDALPPAVARYLLAMPNALTYQFIVVARPAGEHEILPAPESAAPALPAEALYTSELYLGQGGSFNEDDKLTATGTIGSERQTLRFRLPAQPAPGGLKLDPADRPGFMHLYGMRLADAAGATLWQWTPLEADRLAQAPQSGIVLQPPALPSGPFMLLLHGTDPWIELPIPKDALAQAAGGSLEVDAGWPMSADFLALSGVAQQKIWTAEQSARAARDDRDAFQARWQKTSQEAQSLSEQNTHLRMQKQTLLSHNNELSRQRDEALQLVHDIENSTVFRATRPIVHAKMRVDRLLGVGSARKPSTEAMPAQPLTPGDEPVDVIVPVYRGLDDTRRCIESVLASTCRTPWRLVVIDDASPEPEVSAWLQEVAATDSRIELLRNEQNLGFVGTVNRGMALAAERDVLLLNSDTEVANDWLDRIRAAAYGDQKVASVTPFSNNATICSYPRFCQDNALPEGWPVAELDALFAKVNPGQVVDVPTGVGFCMYIRRAALNDVGLFDVEHFGKGYGEENDFCIRAHKAGWRNLHLLDTFVLHSGGVSFGDSKSPRERAAMETLRRLHPDYETRVLRFVREDPARLARTAVDAARILAPGLPVVLSVLHDRQGGTERHVRELSELLNGKAVLLVLRPLPGERVSLRMADPAEDFELAFGLDEAGYEDLLTALRAFGVAHVHYHHLLGHGERIGRLAARLGVSYDFTAHDFYAICPQISLTDHTNGYCGELGVTQCTECLARSPAPDGLNIVTWRQQSAEFLDGARYVISPSRDALVRLAHLVPGAPLRLVPHTDIDPAQPLPAPNPPRLEAPRRLKVAVIGALSTIKGADVLEEVALLARRQQAPVEFHLIGYAYRSLRTQPQAHLTVHGRYDDRDLPALLGWLQPDLVWFPAQWPETYSYTLSACLQGGWPIVAPNLGAFQERLEGRGWTWVRPWNDAAPDWLAFFEDIRSRNFATGQSPAPQIPVARSDAHFAEPQRSRDWYATDYLAGLPAHAPAGGGPERAMLAEHLPAPEESLATGARGAALSALVRLRALPVLAPIARRIPLRWQTRVKTWLRR